MGFFSNFFSASMDDPVDIEPFKIDETKIKGVVSKNTLGTKSNEYRNYLSINTKCLRIALSLRQRTMGKASEITDRSIEENPIGYYFALVESNLRKLSNSLTEIGTVLTLMSVGGSDIDDTMGEALKRASQIFGVATESGTDTTGLSPEEKILAYSETHKIALEKLQDLHQAGCQMEMPDRSLRKDCNEMLSFLREELETAKRLFG
ncbi:MAG: hypothetical protein NV67_03245 [Gammaproteobacteria bacterium (ex Lamellibrachia satsuma)]|nr:MAG: hypothetical protein HPY30_13995 [Gammaproteobacteria bacterium (ex Lamellibrachia satsuma)]RRS37087.1 MAG: hypothetical protein NV67_03245 [Gammaproteobacteria bacterium (ex Lamellibrachia satsuma)]